MKILLVRPPRYLWPFINESDNFLLPLGLPSLASIIRRDVRGVDIKIIDCPPLKIGWTSLADIIKKEKPDIVGAGEEALYHNEAAKLFALSKKINPECITVAGGHFFSWMTECALLTCSVDIVVRFEGELTFVDLVRALMNKSSLHEVQGIAFKENGRVVETLLREPIKNLDDLPIAAYDLMPMGTYSRWGYLWPQSATIEHSRGCIDRCSFCSLWTFWGNQSSVKEGSMDIRPYYRTKSVDRTLEEVDVLYKVYNRRYLLWADPTFNVDPDWTEEFCDKLLARGYKDLYWWAFLRADFALRDEKRGILEKMVKAGMIHPLIGVERGCTEDLRLVNKSVYTRDMVKEVFMIFKKKYPQVFRQGTFVTCLPHDTRQSMLDMVKYAIEIDIDYPAFHPLSPVPGTYLHDEAKKNKQLEVSDYTKYDWATPIMKSDKGLSLAELAELNLELNKRYVLYRPHWLIRGLFSRHRHKRGLYWWFFRNTIKMMFLSLFDFIAHKETTFGLTGFMRLRKPKWYDQ
jgi:anaerobic magnesium-protoporphyrin IX monomethyl ester cyclase